MSGLEAEKTFWRTPELVEGVLPFLDATSILELAKAHPLTRGILKGTYNWSRFIRRSCPVAPPNHETMNCRFAELTEEKVAELRPVIGILQLIGSPHFHLLALLGIICERFPPPSIALAENQFGPEYLKVTQAGYEVQYLSALGFVLLEAVEAAHGSSEQAVGPVFVFNLREPLRSALKSRMTRQEGKIDQVDADFVVIESQDQAEALRTLVQLTEEFVFRGLAIGGAIGEGGWAAVAEAVRVLPLLLLDQGPLGARGFQALVLHSKNLMLDGRREDVRAIWDAMPEETFFSFWNPEMASAKAFGKGFGNVSEEEWARLELYLDNEEEEEEEEEDEEEEEEVVGAENGNPENQF